MVVPRGKPLCIERVPPLPCQPKMGESAMPSGGIADPELALVDRTLSVVGVGFGVTGLALAAALHEAEMTEDALFLESRPKFGWHDDMLIEGSSMQVSFLKDIVTMRNPTSRFSFISYLHAMGRLTNFINHGVLTPSRREFADYLRWVARQLDHLVRYDVHVTDVRPVYEGATVSALDIVAGENAVVRTRNLVLGTGLRPRMPQGVIPNRRVWHSSELLSRLAECGDYLARQIVVVGAGQSAAEIALYLLDRYPDSQVCPVFARYGYSAVDASPFANRIFDPSGVDDFYAASPSVKASLFRYHGNTNYSVVSSDVLGALYRRQYEQSVIGDPRLRIFHASRLHLVSFNDDSVVADIEFLPTGEVTRLDTDLVVIYATGYESRDPKHLLTSLAGYLRTDELGALRLDRRYRVKTVEGFRCGIFVQGATESTHGIASTLLSVAAVRAGEISQSLMETSQARPPAGSVTHRH